MCIPPLVVRARGSWFFRTFHYIFLEGVGDPRKKGLIPSLGMDVQLQVGGWDSVLADERSRKAGVACWGRGGRQNNINWGDFSQGEEGVTKRVRWEAKQGKRGMLCWVLIDLVGEDHSQVWFSSLSLSLLGRCLCVEGKDLHISLLNGSCLRWFRPCFSP